jgi:NAD(P)-dependent dehydrogenase (short-subunit alcohol dehydrogenase family)
VVVTGGASGIGLGMAQSLLVEGALVILADLDPEALREAARTVSDFGPEVLGVATDVSDLESVRRLAHSQAVAPNVACQYSFGFRSRFLFLPQLLLEWAATKFATGTGRRRLGSVE